MSEQPEGRKPVKSERIVVLMTKEERKQLEEGCRALGAQLRTEVSMGEVLRHATFTVYLPSIIKKD